MRVPMMAGNWKMNKNIAEAKALASAIRDAINDVEAAMKGMLDPIFEEKVLGHAEVRQIFKASGIGKPAGGRRADDVE